MKKLLLLFSVFALCMQGVNANSITPAQAQAIAQQQFAGMTKASASNVKTTLGYTAMSKRGQADYYVFNADGNNGFVIVAGDDLSTPVLGYSDMGSFDMNEAPEPLRLMLEEYQYILNNKRNNPELSNKKVSETRYDFGPWGVSPILGDVHWWQGAPYNLYSPAAANMPQDCMGRCYTGCAATALAQIMKALKWPDKGHGGNTYSFMLAGQEITLSANFEHYYNYSRMRTGYGPTSTQSGYQDVAQLFFDIDVALNMRFMGDDGSDAYIRDIIKAMIAYFDFNPNMQYVQKSSYAYNEEAWYDMMYDEIKAGRPVYYLGYRTKDNAGNPCNVGHAFVLDGYDKNGLVHVNWGFQPENYNAYFDFNVLSPRLKDPQNPYPSDTVEMGFNANNAAIIGICKDTTTLGGVVVKSVNLVADTMPANDVRATIDIQALSGSWSGTLKYGIVSKSSDGTYSPYITKTATNIELGDNEILTLDLSGDYSAYYMTQGRTYYVVVYTPYFANSYDWMWFLSNPVPFTIGDWVTPPDPEVLRGDVNGDEKVDIEDATLLINYLLGDAVEIVVANADCDGEEGVDITDATALINYLLYNEW